MVSRTGSPVPQREYHGDGYSVAASFAPIDPANRREEPAPVDHNAGRRGAS